MSWDSSWARSCCSSLIHLVRDLPGSDESHLRPHLGAVGDVEGLQALGVLFAGELGVVTRQARDFSTRAQAMEVHRQGSHIADDVAVPEARAEVQEVQDPRPVGQAEDVVGEQIRVTVTDRAVSAPRQQEGFPPLEVSADQGTGFGEERTVHKAWDCGLEGRQPDVPELPPG